MTSVGRKIWREKNGTDVMLINCSDPSNSGDYFAPVALNAYFSTRSVPVAMLSILAPQCAWLSSRQSPLARPHNPGGQRFANSCDVESVVSLNAGELPGATGPLVSARDDPRRAVFSLIHSKNLVTVLVGDDAVPVYRGGDTINEVVRNCTNHLGFVEETISNVIEEYTL